MVYPATTNAEAVDLNIQNANQFHTILQGDINAEINTYEGLGRIPSVAKAMNEAAAYRIPTPWVNGETELDLLQPRRFNNDVYVPITVPAALGATPDNTLWRLYRPSVAFQQITETRSGADIISGNQLPLADITYIPDSNNITVFVNRSLVLSGKDYSEPSSARIDFEPDSIPDPEDEIFIVSGASTTNVLNPAFSGTTIRSWRFSGTGASTYNILGADSDLPEAYIVRVDGVDLEPTLNYTVDADAGTISFTDDLGDPQTYDVNQRINVLGIGQVVVTDMEGVAGPSTSTDGEVPVYSGTTGNEVTNSPLRVDVSGNFYGHGAKIKTISGTTYTIQEDDSGKILHFTNPLNITVTVPGTSLTYNSNVQCVLVQLGDGTITVEEDGVDSVLNSSGSLFSSAQPYAELALYRYSSTEWLLGGERA